MRAKCPGISFSCGQQARLWRRCLAVHDELGARHPADHAVEPADCTPLLLTHLQRRPGAHKNGRTIRKERIALSVHAGHPAHRDGRATRSDHASARPAQVRGH